MSFEEKTEEIDKSLKCSGCGAILHYKPGTDNLVCIYCGTANPIATDATLQITAVDYDTFMAQQKDQQYTKDATVVKCSSCGASTTMLPGVTADSCPFCASPLVVNLQDTRKILKPHYVLPFIIQEKTAVENFKKWLEGLWFAPNDLINKVKEQSSQQLKGIYIPYWSYNTDTVTKYSGQRGEYYYVTESYTDSNGKTQTRQVRHTRWYPASGVVSCTFRDVLVSASNSLPQNMATELEPWNLEKMKGFNEQYLSGFRSETYQMDAPAALVIAKQKMDPEIQSAICSDIDGDTQQINHYESEYRRLALKYILLPVWISAYKYSDKLYRFVVNACTGEVTGDRPWSWIKITLAILLGLSIVIGTFYFFNQN